METKEAREFFQRVRLPGNPLPHPHSVVVRGGARFTVLTSRLLRMEWSPTGEFTDFATFAFPNRHTEPPVPFEVHQDGGDGGWLRIETGALTLRYRVGSGAFNAENLAIMLRVGGETHTWRPGQPNPANLSGTRRTLDMTGGEVPLEPGLVSRDGWALFDDSAAVVVRPNDGWVAARPAQSVLDWYFFGYGHAYADALAEYAQFGGAAPLIPRYVLGIWWSRFWPYTAADLEQLAAEFADRHLPLDVLVVDMDWHLPPHWTGYTWNPTLFPDPEAFLAEMHRRGLHVTLNLHPAEGVHPSEAAYAAFAAALGPAVSAGAAIPFRITDRQFAERYFALLHHPLEDQGVDFWWLDWQQGESSDIAGLDPLLWLNHLHFMDARRRGRRPLLFSRWGGLGNHRYPIGFSGDTFAGWPTLAALPHFTATAANVGFGWWSHDIGGHFGAVDAELFTRWVQFGALSPCLRLHAVKHVLAERRPWAFSPRVLAAVRQAFELRHALVPYLYTMARQTHDRGAALCRPLYYAYPEQESAYLARGQYMLGDDLVAAPVTDPADPHTGLATKDVWIPPGTWFQFETGAAFVGPRWVRLSCALETIPLFARAGAIVPMAKPALHLDDIPNDWLDLHVFPGSEGDFWLYEDDGITEGYLSGAYEWTNVTYRCEHGERHVLRIEPVEGHCAALPESRAYRVTFVGLGAPAGVVDEHGAPLPWTRDQDEHALHVTVPARAKAECVEVIVRMEASRDRVLAPARASDGDPFAHVVAFTASDEARRHLARLVLVPPVSGDQQGGRCDAEVRWREVTHAGVTEQRAVVPNLTAEAVLTAPFVLDATPQPRHWEVETRFTTEDGVLVDVTSGPYLNPPIQRWRVRYAGQIHWHVFEADVAARLTMTAPYDVRLDSQEAAGAEARALIDLPQSMSVCFDAWTAGGLELEVDGKVLAQGEPQATVVGLARPWQAVRFGPVVLAAGTHVIQVQLTAPDEGPWLFGVLLVDAGGAPVVRCAQVYEQPESVGQQ